MYTERSLKNHRDWNDIEGVRTHDHLARNPEQQAEAITHHYTRLAAMSISLLELVKIRRSYGSGLLTDAAIEFVLNGIREAHLKDLGIPLEWKADNTTFHND